MPRRNFYDIMKTILCPTGSEEKSMKKKGIFFAESLEDIKNILKNRYIPENDKTGKT